MNSTENNYFLHPNNSGKYSISGFPLHMTLPQCKTVKTDV